ncbi:MAG TPA: hypothetical protein PLU16_00745 [Gallionellaceae bacterium]|nr:hypothetical protein [Gallionellaceae bacterium]HQS73703.1 hypothetical protein [Gallionellaceae bacterium]
MMSMEFIAKIFSQILQLLAIVFFFYAAYQGVMGEGGSTSVFTGVGVLILVLIGSYFIDKLVNAY